MTNINSSVNQLANLLSTLSAEQIKTIAAAAAALTPAPVSEKKVGRPRKAVDAPAAPAKDAKPQVIANYIGICAQADCAANEALFVGFSPTKAKTEAFKIASNALGGKLYENVTDDVSINAYVAKKVAEFKAPAAAKQAPVAATKQAPAEPITQKPPASAPVQQKAPAEPVAALKTQTEYYVMGYIPNNIAKEAVARADEMMDMVRQFNINPGIAAFMYEVTYNSVLAKYNLKPRYINVDAVLQMFNTLQAKNGLNKI
jgi:hypothetical protein